MAEYNALTSLAGGMLIGLSAALMLLLNGRVAGVSGIVGRLFQPGAHDMGSSRAAGLAFVAGLVLGPVAYLSMTGDWPLVRMTASLPVLLLAGLLVGFGTRMGSGCTSGHGVVGLARLSPRSIAAVVTFIGAAMLTVLVVGFWR